MISARAGEVDRLESLFSSHIATAESSNPGFDPASTQRRVRDFYVPVYKYFCDVLHTSNSNSNGSNSNSNRKTKKKPVFIGISAPQGCGKTTLTDYMRLLFASEGVRCIVMSLDDFYLTGKAQDELAERTRNPLLAYRGNAGTHDMPLMKETLNALADSEEVSVPRYDKALRSGRGDRSPADLWEKVAAGDADIVLFEGWMLGFSPLDGAAAAALTPNLQQVNDLLQRYEPLDALFDAWLVLALADIGAVYKWRAQAERAALASGRAGLSEEQVVDFVSRFMPAYQTYLPQLYEDGPRARRAAATVLKVTVAADRSVVGQARM